MLSYPSSAWMVRVRVRARVRVMLELRRAGLERAHRLERRVVAVHEDDLVGVRD